MIHYVEIEEIYFLHERMIEIGGGKQGIRDFSLIHSAIERPKATFGAYELYPDIWHKAAALFHSLLKNHGFYDGNKRTAFFSTQLFLKKNTYVLKPPKKEIVSFTLSINANNLNIDQIAKWLEKHTHKIRF